MLFRSEDIEENDLGGCATGGTVVAAVEDELLEEKDESLSRLSGTTHLLKTNHFPCFSSYGSGPW